MLFDCIYLAKIIYVTEYYYSTTILSQFTQVGRRVKVWNPTFTRKIGPYNRVSVRCISNLGAKHVQYFKSIRGTARNRLMEMESRQPVNPRRELDAFKLSQEDM